MAEHNTPSPSSPAPALDWKEALQRGGPLHHAPLEHSINGWSSPPPDLFLVRGPNYLTKKHKIPSGPYLLQPLGVDWLKAHSKLDHVLSLPDNRVMQALLDARARGDALGAFIFAVNLQVPGKEHYSAVFYYVTEDNIPQQSLFYRFIHGDDGFRNSRFKLINRIVRGPWIVRAAVGNHAACLLGKALTCRYIKGPNYLEIDVDIGSSTIASAILHLALGYASSVTVDMAFLIESQTEEELPERLLGAVRISQIDLGSAGPVEVPREVSVFSHGLTHESSFSWRRLSRGLSLLSHGGKAGKIEAEEGNKASA